MMSRRTRSTIPTHPNLLKPKVVPTNDIISESIEKKKENKKYYDRRSKDLLPLVVRNHVRAKIQPKSSKLLSQGEITKINNDRSCNVNVDGREYRRNRIHIRKSGEIVMKKNEPPLEYEDIDIQQERKASEKYYRPIIEKVNSKETPRRSQRLRKPHPKYKDFIIYK